MPLLVLSHDCELENVRARLGILVAPVLHWPTNVDDDALRESTRPSASADGESVYEFGQLWPLFIPRADPEGNPAVAEWMVADFSGMTSVAPPTKVTPIFRRKRRFEMTDESRRLLQDKLAAYFLS
jgi:hypothetical protein